MYTEVILRSILLVNLYSNKKVETIIKRKATKLEPTSPTQCI